MIDKVGSYCKPRLQSMRFLQVTVSSFGDSTFKGLGAVPPVADETASLIERQTDERPTSNIEWEKMMKQK